MLELRDYCGQDAVGLASLIRTRQVSAAEVEDTARRAVAAVNDDLNALTRPLFEPAQGYQTDGPLAGVPFLVKDSGPFARGVPFTLGSRGIRGAVTGMDHELMARFRAAGLTAIGQTTTPELSFSFATESAMYGVTRSPWDLTRGVGGSSGGSAALVAAGAVPVAHGSDGAGSVRVPASCCGLVGLKPGRGRTPGGYAGPGACVAVDFALTRTVRDTAHLLDAVAYLGPGPRGYADQLTARAEPLRVAVTTAAWSGVPVDAQVAGATVSVADMLEWIGHHVVEASPAIDADLVVEGEMLAVYAAGAALLGAPRQPDRALLEGVSRAVLAETLARTDAGLTSAVRAQRQLTASIARFFSNHDVLVTPTIGQLPARHGTLDYDNTGYSVRGWLRRIFEYGPFTAPFNVSGVPSISLPLGMSREGLPIGVQLVAAAGREDVLIRLAAQLEQAMPWADQQPSIFAG